MCIEQYKTIPFHCLGITKISLCVVKNKKSLDQYFRFTVNTVVSNLDTFLLCTTLSLTDLCLFSGSSGILRNRFIYCRLCLLWHQYCHPHIQCGYRKACIELKNILQKQAFQDITSQSLIIFKKINHFLNGSYKFRKGQLIFL